MQSDESKSKFIASEYITQYKKLHYKRIAVDMPPETNNIICDYCDDIKISRTKFLTAAALYCIDNAIDIDELLSHLK